MRSETAARAKKGVSHGVSQTVPALARTVTQKMGARRGVRLENVPVDCETRRTGVHEMQKQQITRADNNRKRQTGTAPVETGDLSSFRDHMVTK